MKKNKVVMIRHGESKWNKINKFTGWQDIDLSKKGEEEAENSSKKLMEQGFLFDYAFSSMLKRSIHTLWIILKKMNQSWIPIEKSWRLNERHYGSLEGLDKNETKDKYGNKQVKLWRRSFSVSPPSLDFLDPRYPGKDRKYKDIKKNNIPISESLKITLNRVVIYWNSKIFPLIKKEKNILIVAHGNSLRALIKYLGNISDESIVNLNIPTGIPIVYNFSKEFKPKNYYFLS